MVQMLLWHSCLHKWVKQSSQEQRVYAAKEYSRSTIFIAAEPNVVTSDRLCQTNLSLNPSLHPSFIK